MGWFRDKGRDERSKAKAQFHNQCWAAQPHSEAAKGIFHSSLGDGSFDPLFYKNDIHRLIFYINQTFTPGVNATLW